MLQVIFFGNILSGVARVIMRFLNLTITISVPELPGYTSKGGIESLKRSSAFTVRHTTKFASIFGHSSSSKKVLFGDALLLFVLARYRG